MAVTLIYSAPAISYAHLEYVIHGEKKWFIELLMMTLFIWIDWILQNSRVGTRPLSIHEINLPLPACVVVMFIMVHHSIWILFNGNDTFRHLNALTPFVRSYSEEGVQMKWALSFHAYDIRSGKNNGQQNENQAIVIKSTSSPFHIYRFSKGYVWAVTVCVCEWENESVFQFPFIHIRIYALFTMALFRSQRMLCVPDACFKCCLLM